MQGTSSWLWRFTPLLLRLLGEISLSLLCSHSSWGSALDLDPPLHVGHLRASVPHPDRTGLKERLIRGLWLTQAGGREGYGYGASLHWQRPAWCCNSLRCAECYPRALVPGSWDPGSGGLHRLLGGAVWIVTCACTQASWCCSSSLSVSCPSLGSALIVAAHACLWSSFRRCSETPFLAHPETTVSYLLGSFRLFPGHTPGWLWRTSPLQAVFTQPTPTLPGGWAEKPLGLVSAGRHWSSVRASLRFALHTPVAVLSSMAPKLPHFATRSLRQWRGFLVCGNFSSFTAPSQRCRSHPYSFVSVFSFFFCPTQVYGEFLAFWEVWGLLPAFSRCSVGVVPHVDVFLMYLWGGRWSPYLTPPPSWRSLSPVFS